MIMAAAKTSETDPIRVDFLPREACTLRGRVGLTLAPGKRDDVWERDLVADVERLRETFGTSVLISLVGDAELQLLGIPDLDRVARTRGVRVCQLPVEDGGVPENAEGVVRLVRMALAVAEAGETVVVHCRGGLGRSGLFAACCLIALGHEPAAAIRIVRAVRPGAVETLAQERFIERFVDVWRRAAPVVPSLSRVAGCLLGGALGDALGYPVEFLKAASEIERVLGPLSPARLPRSRGGKALISDDTQMTLFTAEGLIRAQHRAMDRGNCSPPVVILGAYQRWLSTQTGSELEQWEDPLQRGWLIDVPELRARRAPGNTCLSALVASLTTGAVPSIDARPNDSKGCGAIVRSSPIGLVANDIERAFQLGRDSGVLTHGHPSGYLSAAYFAAVVHQLVRDASLRDAMQAADELLRREPEAGEVLAAVDAARDAAAAGKPSRGTIERLGGGWVGEEALGIALLCALTTEDGTPASVAASLWRAVAHGGDSDSTGSLVGNLLGAMYGVEALPSAWLEDLELREVIERVARDLHITCVLGFEPDFRRYPPN
jgi:ADP-ribosylglycohydrolase/protein-tyrosine phosphatase